METGKCHLVLAQISELDGNNENNKDNSISTVDIKSKVMDGRVRSKLLQFIHTIQT